MRVKNERYEIRNGFTLLELIIAITILSLVTLLIGSGFRLAFNAWEKGENETGETQKLRVLSGLMSKQFKSAYPYKMEIDEEQVVVFRGGVDSVLFVTALTDFPYGGFKWVKYLYKDGNLLYKEGLLPDKELIEKISGSEEIIDTDIEEVKFSYFSSDEEEWKETWEFGKNLPGAIRIKISYFQPFFINIPMGSIKKEDEKDKKIIWRK